MAFIDEDNNYLGVQPSPPPGTSTPPPAGGGTSASTVPGAGLYAEQQGLAQNAYNNALASINQQRNSSLTRYGYNAQGQVDPANQYGAYQQMQHGYNTGVTRENEDYQSQLENLTRQRTNTLRGTGLSENAQGGLTMGDNPMGEFQQMLKHQTQGISDTANARVSRGLGAGGLGGKAKARAEEDSQAQSYNYKQQLLNSLSDQTANQKNYTRQHTRTLEDLDWQHGTQQQNMGLDIGDMMLGFDQQTLGAGSTRDQSLFDARKEQILAALQGRLF